MSSQSSDATFHRAAYGGEGWQPRQSDHAEEMGSVWAECGIDSEWKPLRSIMLHRPGEELQESLQDPEKVQMLDRLDLGLAREEHDRMARTYAELGVEVNMLAPQSRVAPNQMFCADLFAMTPQGAVLARPASSVRMGEERVMARKLAELGVPILKTLTGGATFEGADLIWLHDRGALLGLGLRTNRQAYEQLSVLFLELGVTLVPVDMPFGTMHLMGMLRIVDRDLAIAWPRRTPHAAVVALREAGYRVVFLSENEEVHLQRAFNFVTLGPRRVLMVEGNPRTRKFLESLDIECNTSPASELGKAAGAIGCLTGIVRRDLSA